MIANKPKINSPNNGGKQSCASDNNRFALMSDVENITSEPGQAVQKKVKAPTNFRKGT